MSKEMLVDLAIIGAGTAGISAYKEASKFTDNLVMIDHGPLGTTCARVGCMPSKALLQVSDYFHDRIHFDAIGIKGADKLHVEIPTVMKHVKKLRDSFTAGIVSFIDSLGDNFISGNALFIDPNTLQVGDQKIHAQKIIIATGSHNNIPDDWHSFSHLILSSDNIFEQEDFQKNIAVIGAGPIGLELGQALARLGIKINLFHSHDFIGELTDPVVNEQAIKLIRTELALHVNAKASVQKQQNKFEITSGKTHISADQVVAALGRKPNLAELGLEKVGMALDKSGMPFYDKSTLKIENFPIFIAGDVSGIRPLLHEAADEGRIAGYNALQKEPHCFIRRVPLNIIFMQPNIAQVGTLFKDLEGSDFIIGEVHFEDQGRSRIMLQNKGIARIYADKKTGRLLGAEMIAPAGEHLAHLIAFAIREYMSVFDFLQLPFYHPTVEEGLRTALRNIASQVVNKPKDSFELAMCDSEAMINLQ